MSWANETSHKGKFNNRLFQFMTSQGWTPSTLSSAAGISERQLWNILHGCSCPRIDTLMRICQVLHIKLDDIYPVKVYA